MMARIWWGRGRLGRFGGEGGAEGWGGDVVEVGV